MPTRARRSRLRMTPSTPGESGCRLVDRVGARAPVVHKPRSRTGRAPSRRHRRGATRQAPSRAVPPPSPARGARQPRGARPASPRAQPIASRFSFNARLRFTTATSPDNQRAARSSWRRERFASIVRSAANEPRQQRTALVGRGSRRVRRRHSASVHLVENRSAVRVDARVTRVIEDGPLDSTFTVAAVAPGFDDRLDLVPPAGRRRRTAARQIAGAHRRRGVPCHDRDRVAREASREAYQREGQARLGHRNEEPTHGGRVYLPRPRVRTLARRERQQRSTRAVVTNSPPSSRHRTATQNGPSPSRKRNSTRADPSGKGVTLTSSNATYRRTKGSTAL